LPNLGSRNSPLEKALFSFLGEEDKAPPPFPLVASVFSLPSPSPVEFIRPLPKEKEEISFY